MRSIWDDTPWAPPDDSKRGYPQPRRLLLAADVFSACVAILAMVLFLWARDTQSTQLHITEFNSIVMLVLTLALLLQSRQYSTRKRLSSLSAMAILLRDTIIAAAVTTLLSYVTKGFFTGYTTPSRLGVFLAMGVFVALGFIFRMVLGAVQNRQYAAGQGVRKILVAGTGTVGADLLHFVDHHSEMGLKVVGMIRLDVPGWPTEAPGDVPVATITDDREGFAKLDRLIRATGACEIVVALDPAHQVVLPELASFLTSSHVPFKVVPSLFEETYLISDMLGNITIPVVDFRVSALDRMGRFAKRVLDVSLSVFVLVVLSPLLLIICLAIVLCSGFPVIFAQERVGKNGRRFMLFKFRTMVKDAEAKLKELEAQNELEAAEGRMFKIRSDPRITGVGSVLRKFSLDELPQFINVIRGEMSVVGPRPPLPREVANYEAEHLYRLRVLPGITGLWQVSGRNELSFEDMIKLDRYYVDNWSMRMDLKIMVKTLITLLTRKGAY